MKYVGLLILLTLFIQSTVASIKDIKFGKQVSESDKPEEIEKKKAALKRGIVGIILETLALLWIGIMLLYFSFIPA